MKNKILVSSNEQIVLRSSVFLISNFVINKRNNCFSQTKMNLKRMPYVNKIFIKTCQYFPIYKMEE